MKPEQLHAEWCAQEMRRLKAQYDATPSDDSFGRTCTMIQAKATKIIADPTHAGGFEMALEQVLLNDAMWLD